MIQVLLSGACGRMGRAVAALSAEYGFSVAAGIDVNTADKEAFPLYSSYALCHEKADCLIDFSRPAHLPQTLQYAREHQLPLLVGTTGLESAHDHMLTDAAQHIPVLQSVNFSPGIYVLKRLTAQTAAWLKGYDIEIVERHHANKADAPGGTALLLYKAAAAAQTQPVYGRHTALQRRSPQEIGLHAVRGGTLCGMHEASFYGHDEHLTLVHTAESRDVFARGALKAAKWLLDQPPGRYSMEDLFS